ncbi:endonuclease/exonuclease/phosphatase family protein [Mesorhizobium loti]|uniref:endonuclease/exonuclease/phosphatase family protein n=1 Tax=Rhizobium loti TaxID=381 RepID=UPI001FD944D1|nr:endonuclease/exonuclease/phosphatase family protein [Mesorhizobium loti]
MLTFNVWNNQGDARRTEMINREIIRLQPDLISLQEVIRTHEDNQLGRLLAGLDFSVTHQTDLQRYTPPFLEKYGGAAIASRWPHKCLEVIDGRTSGVNDVPWATLAASVAIPDLGDLLFIGTTSAWRLNAEIARERQALGVTDLDARHRTTLPSVIAGDFNSSPDAASIRYLTGLQSLEGRSAHYHDAWATAGEGEGLTWTTLNPNAADVIEQIVGQLRHGRRIDYIFLGGWDAHPRAKAKVVDIKLAFDKPIDGLWLSDHFGVLADIEISAA